MKQLCDGKRPRGRQRKLTPEVAELIIERLANGELLRAICRDLDIAPSIVYQYKLDNKEFDDSFTRARDFSDDLMEEDAIEIIDEESPTEDTEIEYAADGKPIGGKRRRSSSPVSQALSSCLLSGERNAPSVSRRTESTKASSPVP